MVQGPASAQTAASLPDAIAATANPAEPQAPEALEPPGASGPSATPVPSSPVDASAGVEDVLKTPHGPTPAPRSPSTPRKAVLAGSWYPADPDLLRGQIGEFLSRVKPTSTSGYPVALIAPHAGVRYSGQIAAQAYATLKGRTYARVFVLAPSHRAAFHGISASDYSHFETPLGSIETDREALGQLREHFLFVDAPSAHEKEHAVEIQLPFLQSVLPSFRLVPLVVGRLTPEEVSIAGDVLKEAIRPGDLVVVSSDFTHYGEDYGYLGPPEATFSGEEAPERLPLLQESAWKEISGKSSAGLLKHRSDTGDTICGILPIALLLELLPADSRAVLLATDFSGRMTGDYSNSVSYLAAEFTGLWPYNGTSRETHITRSEKRDLLKLARRVVEGYVKSGRKIGALEAGIEVTPVMREDFGAFVTLKEEGDLRGCIGTILPVKSLLEAVMDNAVNAAAYDRRFEPVGVEELERIEVEISVLTPPVPISGAGDIILGLHGVILEKDGRSAVFLPQVAPEQGWTLEEMLTHLSRKAGLGPEGWRSGASFSVFEAIVFSEGE